MDSEICFPYGMCTTMMGCFLVPDVPYRPATVPSLVVTVKSVMVEISTTALVALIRVIRIVAIRIS